MATQPRQTAGCPTAGCPTAGNLTAWKWTAFLLGTVWVAIGCTPATLTYMMMPFSDDRIPPKCKLAEKKEVTVCVVTKFSSQEIRPDAVPAGVELADLFTQQLRKRASENKDRIKIVPAAKVRDYLKQPDGAARAPVEVGKHFKADYVIALDVAKLSLFERSSFQQLFRGNTEINVQVLDLRKAADEMTIYDEWYRREYPGRGPVDAGEMSAPMFRSRFLNAVSADLARMFLAYPTDERYEME